MDRGTPYSQIATIFPHAVTLPSQKRMSEYEGLMDVRLACPVSPSTGYDSEWPHLLTLLTPALTPEPHGPSSTAIRGGEHALLMLRALTGFGDESARASSDVPRVAVRDQRAGGLERGVSIL